MRFMNQTIRRRLACVAVAIATLWAVSPATLSAQDSGAAEVVATDPVVVVSLGSIDKLMQDVGYLTGAVGQAQAGGMFSMMVGTFTQGIDKSKPIGILLPLVNDEPQPIALIPTADVKTLLRRLEGQTGPADELKDGTLVIAIGANTVFIRQTDNWAVLAPKKSLLDLAPADPMSVFEGLGNNYDLSFRIQMQEVPPELRDMVVTQLRQGFEQAMAQQGNAEAAATREVTEGSLQQLEQLIEDTDELVFGFNIDQEAKEVVFDTTFKAVAGSDLAKVQNGQQPIPSRFASVIRPDAASYYHVATSISQEGIDQVNSTLHGYFSALENTIAGESNLSGEDLADLTELLERVGGLVISSIEEGKADAGALLLADKEDFQFVLGAFVSDGNEAAEIVKDLADKVKDERGAPTFKFDQSTHNGITMHVIEADVPEDEDEARRVFGDTLRVHIGTGDKAVYVAVGSESEALMKSLIDAGGSDESGPRPLTQLEFKLLPILEFAQSIESQDSLSAMIDALQRSPDPGVVTIVSDSIENGATSKVTLGEGLLQAIGAAIQQSQRNQAQF